MQRWSQLPARWLSGSRQWLELSSSNTFINGIITKSFFRAIANDINSERWSTTFSKIDSCGYFGACLGYSKNIIIRWCVTNTPNISEWLGRCLGGFWRFLGGFGTQQTVFASCVMCMPAPIVFWYVVNACLTRVGMSMSCFRQLVT